MQAKDTRLLTFMRKVTQSLIPIYQRTYSWKLEQCEQLWAPNYQTYIGYRSLRP